MAIGAGAIFKGFSSILGGIGQAKAIRAENARRIREYERALEMRKRGWFQQLSIYGAKVNKYNIDLNENDLAAQRGYAKAQSNLRALQGSVTAQNEKRFRELLAKKFAGRRASGQTGRSVRRGETLDMAAFGRYVGRQSYALSMANQQFKENVESIKRKQTSARRGLYSKVAFNPVPSMAPNPPQLRGTGMTMLNAFVGAAGAFADGMQMDPGAPVGGLENAFDQSFDTSFLSPDIDFSGFSSNILPDMGGVGAFTSFDFNQNSLPNVYNFGDGGFSF